MDCYIVRVYRDFIRKDNQADEIAGLGEHVGRPENGKPFTSYTELADALRVVYRGNDDRPAEADGDDEPDLRLVKNGMGRRF